ncbi:MAG: hypothetical protein WBW61_08110 [Rhodanobacteraceae bacterium]
MNVRSARMTTNVLIGACALLCLFVIFQYAGLGSGYRWLVEAPDTIAASQIGKIERETFKLPAASSFAAIEARPLFNDDRKPTPLDESDDATDEAATASPLNVTLTGVIVTPKVRIALVRDNVRNQSLALKVGMPLEGDQASWILTEIKPRSAVFRSAADEDAEIELETAAAPTQRATPGRNARRPGNKAAALKNNGAFSVHSPGNAGAGGGDSDLAKRIAERRRQMREDAARLRKERAQKKGQRKNPAHQK